MKFFIALMLLLTAIVACTIPETKYSFVEVGQLIQVESSGRYILMEPEKYKSLIPRAEKFFDLIQNDFTVGQTKFVNTNLAPDNIVATIRASKDFNVKVSTYGWWKDKYSAAIAYYTKSEGIKLNKYKLNRDDCSILNTLVHEYMHHLGFSHASNDVKGEARDRSAPYWFGSKAESYCRMGII